MSNSKRLFRQIITYILEYCIGGGAGFITPSCHTLATLWTVPRQVPLSMEFPRQEYWSGLIKLITFFLFVCFFSQNQYIS